MTSATNAAALDPGTKGGDDLAGSRSSDESTSNTDERATVGALLQVAADLGQLALDRLRDSDFSDYRCRFLVGVIRAMYDDGVPVDFITTAAYIEQHALLDPGPFRRHIRSYLHELTMAAPTPVNVGWYVDSLRSKARRDRIAEAGRRLIVLADLAADDTVADTAVATVQDAVSQ